jgi:hypothetical protein
MTKRYPILTAAILMLGTAGASAGELPRYDFAGLPVTAHQMSVLGLSGNVQERPAAPTIMHDSMPASPHQIAVLSSRPARSFTSAESHVGTVTRAE